MNNPRTPPQEAQPPRKTLVCFIATLLLLVCLILINKSYMWYEWGRKGELSAETSSYETSSSEQLSAETSSYETSSSQQDMGFSSDSGSAGEPSDSESGGIPKNSSDTGGSTGGTSFIPRSFWHITDVHLETDYVVGAAAGPGKTTRCTRDATGGGSETAGSIGSYYCDASPALVESALDLMKTVDADPAFIVFGGDVVPHGIAMSEEFFLNAFQMFTDMLTARFPNTRVFPMLGNHDVNPVHQGFLLAGDTHMFQKIGDIWADWLSPQALESFKRIGCYSEVISPGLRIIVLNSVMFYYSNYALHKTHNLNPNGMVTWLVSELKKSRANGETVILGSHINPGVNEKSGAPVDNPELNKVYVDALLPYLDIIEVQLYGHLHADSFRVFFDAQGAPASMGYISPAVEPWYNYYNGKYNSNNPGVRLFRYNESIDDAAFVLTDYDQYFGNLEELNEGGGWKLEYTATEAYGMGGVAPSDWADLVDRLESDADLFSLYHRLNSVSIKEVHPPGLYPCDDRSCRYDHICGLKNVRQTSFAKCKQDSGT